MLMFGHSLLTAQDDVSTGPDPLSKSSVPSNYAVGSTTDSSVAVNTLRIVGVQRSSEGALTVRLILLDVNGNIVSSRNTPRSFTIGQSCRGESPSTQVISESANVSATRFSTPVSAMVLVDNSMLSQGMAVTAIAEIGKSLSTIVDRDTVSVSLYSHDVVEIVPPSAVGLAAELCVPKLVNEPDGLTATYASAFSALRVLAEQSSPRVLILVVSSDDNASITTSTSDIVQRARASGCSIYTIRVGRNTRAYPYRYISHATGGSLYTVDEDSVVMVGAIVREILYCTTRSTTLEIPYQQTDSGCTDILLNVQYLNSDSGIVVADSVIYPFTDRSYRTSPATISVFTDTTDVGLRSFYPLLGTLAERLMEDTVLKVELTGHVSSDTRGNADERALERASFVRDFLSAYGVNPKQVSLRTEGSRKPIFYMQLNGAQKLLNNRVEARFLVPNELPFSIVVDQVLTEEQAGKSADKWEKRGYKAYFEPVLLDNAPAYRIRLWGYASKSAAQRDASALKKYRPRITIVE